MRDGSNCVDERATVNGDLKAFQRFPYRISVADTAEHLQAKVLFVPEAIRAHWMTRILVFTPSTNPRKIFSSASQ